MAPADPGYLALKTLHVLAAAVLLGGLVVMERFRARATDSGGRRARSQAWEFLGSASPLLAWSLLVLLLTGLLMVAGPLAGGWSLARDWWTSAGLVLVVLLGGLLGAVVSANGARVAKAHKEGRAEDAALARAERAWRVGVLASAALAALAVALMVVKPAL